MIKFLAPLPGTKFPISKLIVFFCSNLVFIFYIININIIDFYFNLVFLFIYYLIYIFSPCFTFEVNKKMLHQDYIVGFSQQHNEPFYSAWGRFNELGERCYHNFSREYLTLFFDNGLDDATRCWVNYGVEVTGEPLLRRCHDDIMELLNDMADFDYHWHWDPSLQGWSHQYPPSFQDPNIIPNHSSMKSINQKLKKYWLN